MASHDRTEKVHFKRNSDGSLTFSKLTVDLIEYFLVIVLCVLFFVLEGKCEKWHSGGEHIEVVAWWLALLVIITTGVFAVIAIYKYNKQRLESKSRKDCDRDKHQLTVDSGTQNDISYVAPLAPLAPFNGAPYAYNGLAGQYATYAQPAYSAGGGGMNGSVIPGVAG